MKTKYASILFLLSCALFPLQGHAQRVDNDVMANKAYTCDFLPESGITVGAIFGVEQFWVFPQGASEKVDFLTNQFEQPYNDPDKRIDVAGVTTRSTQKISAAAGANYFGRNAIEGNFSASKQVTLLRSIKSHYIRRLYTDEVQPIRQWFQTEFSKSSSFNKKAKYYIVTEVRFADGLEVSINKQSLAGIVGDAEVLTVGGAAVSATRESGSDVILDTQFPQPLVFCALLRRVKP